MRGAPAFTGSGLPLQKLRHESRDEWPAASVQAGEASTGPGAQRAQARRGLSPSAARDTAALPRLPGISAALRMKGKARFASLITSRNGTAPKPLAMFLAMWLGLWYSITRGKERSWMSTFLRPGTSSLRC